MSVALPVPAPELEALFGALVNMARDMVRIATGPESVGVAELDMALERGAFVRMEFGLGSAGPISLTLNLVAPWHGAVELGTVAAPASKVAFRFGRP